MSPQFERRQVVDETTTRLGLWRDCDGSHIDPGARMMVSVRRESVGEDGGTGWLREESELGKADTQMPTTFILLIK